MTKFKLLVNSDKDTVREALERQKIHFSNPDAKFLAQFAGHEHEMVYDLDLDTGEATLVKVDDREFYPEDEQIQGLTFEEWSNANRVRMEKDYDGRLHAWSLMEWLGCVLSEAGEAYEQAKKMRRVEDILTGYGVHLWPEGRTPYPIEQTLNAIDTMPDLPDDDKDRCRQLVAEWYDRFEKCRLEFPDFITYAELAAQKMGFNLGDACIEKFNIVSERVGSSVRL